VVFIGDDMWIHRFGSYIDRSKGWPCLDIADLDTVDNAASAAIYEELDSGSKFKLMVAHICGVDSAGHSYGPLSPQIERKLKDTNEIISRIA